MSHDYLYLNPISPSNHSQDGGSGRGGSPSGGVMVTSFNELGETSTISSGDRCPSPVISSPPAKISQAVIIKCAKISQSNGQNGELSKIVNIYFVFIFVQKIRQIALANTPLALKCTKTFKNTRLCRPSLLHFLIVKLVTSNHPIRPVSFDFYSNPKAVSLIQNIPSTQSSITTIICFLLSLVDLLL